MYGKAVISHFVEKCYGITRSNKITFFQAIKESVKPLVVEEDYDLKESWK